MAPPARRIDFVAPKWPFAFAASNNRARGIPSYDLSGDIDAGYFAIRERAKDTRDVTIPDAPASGCPGLLSKFVGTFQLRFTSGVHWIVADDRRAISRNQKERTMLLYFELHLIHCHGR
jgi:hypothetical protein